MLAPTPMAVIWRYCKMMRRSNYVCIINASDRIMCGYVRGQAHWTVVGRGDVTICEHSIQVGKPSEYGDPYQNRHYRGRNWKLFKCHRTDSSNSSHIRDIHKTRSRMATETRTLKETYGEQTRSGRENHLR